MKVNLTIMDGQNTKTMELTREALALIADGGKDKANELASRIGETSRTPEATRAFSVEGLQKLQTELRAFSEGVEKLLVSGK